MRRLGFLLVIGVAGFATLVALGLWQVRRLHWKEGILSDMAARMESPLPALPVQPEEKADEYRSLTVTGSVLPGEVHVLTSEKGEGPGYLVIAPLALPDGRHILLERGFIAEGEKDAPRPVPGGPLAVDGNLLWPDDANSWTPEPNRSRNIWFARDVDGMAATLGTEPVLLVARSDTGSGIRPVPVTINIPNDHLQYAVTWFGLAAVWGGMCVYFVRSARRSPA